MSGKMPGKPVTITDVVHGLEARAEKAEQERDALAEALRFYSKARAYGSPPYDVWVDDGKVARAALKQIGGESS